MLAIIYLIGGLITFTVLLISLTAIMHMGKEMITPKELAQELALIVIQPLVWPVIWVIELYKYVKWATTKHPDAEDIEREYTE